MSQRDLIISFLSSAPTSIVDQLQNAPAQIVCPVQQASVKDEHGNIIQYGGRTGYRMWLAEYMDGERNVIAGIARSVGIAEEDIGRVCVMGFSNGCIGVDELLKCNDAFRVDTVLAVDGIHGRLAHDGSLLPGLYKSIANFAAFCAQRNPEQHPHAPVCIITHSSIGPIMERLDSGRIVAVSPSTTQTADLIWRMVSTKLPADYLSPDCGYGCLPVMHMERMRQQWTAEDGYTMCAPRKICRCAPDKVCPRGDRTNIVCAVKTLCFTWYAIEDGWYDKRGANNFFVLGWGDVEDGKAHTKDPAGYADHIFQGKVVLTALLEEFIINRWNRTCLYVAAAGLGAGPPGGAVSSCKLGQGTAYSETDAGVVDFFPDIQEDTQAWSRPCTPPPPGGAIVGSADDPCAVIGRQPDSPARPAPVQVGAGAAAMFVLACVGGYYAVRRFRG